jgi:hypothetical protein
MERLKRFEWGAGIVSVPPVLMAVGWVTGLVIWGITGQHPVWERQPRNLAEAAAMRDSVEIVRRVERGEGLNRPGEVRARILADDAAVLTPLEAAAASRERDVVQLVFELGASPDAATWQRAWCISSASSVQELLDLHRPEGAEKDCAASR